MAAEQEPFNAREHLRPVLQRKWFVPALVVFTIAATYASYADRPKVDQASTKILIAATGNPLDQPPVGLSDRTALDVDLRRSTLASLFDQRSQPELTDVLTGSISRDDALVTVPVQVHGLEALSRMGAATNAGAPSAGGLLAAPGETLAFDE